MKAVVLQSHKKPPQEALFRRCEGFQLLVALFKVLAGHDWREAERLCDAMRENGFITERERRHIKTKIAMEIMLPPARPAYRDNTAGWPHEKPELWIAQPHSSLAGDED